MAALTGETEREMSEVFAPSLLPIAAAYTVAHYFSYLLLEGQQIIALVSDPFGRGRDFFGTAGYLVDFTLISTDAIALGADRSHRRGPRHGRGGGPRPGCGALAAPASGALPVPDAGRDDLLHGHRPAAVARRVITMRPADGAQP